MILRNKQSSDDLLSMCAQPRARRAASAPGQVRVLVVVDLVAQVDGHDHRVGPVPEGANIVVQYVVCSLLRYFCKLFFIPQRRQSGVDSASDPENPLPGTHRIRRAPYPGPTELL